MSRDRINFFPDFIFSLVKAPAGWKPRDIYDVPPTGVIVSQVPVASLEEALEDLVRSNKVSLEHGRREWAIIQTVDAGAQYEGN